MSTSSVSSVGFLLLATATTLITDANTGAKLYWGHKLVKVFPRSHADVKILSRVKYMGNVTAEIWRPPTRPGSSVDMKVSADDFFKLKSLLNNYGIGFKVQITDIQSLINRQNDESNRSLSWHKSYHTLKEIVIEMKRINQTTRLVNMKSIGKSFGKRDLYIMQIQANNQTNKPLVFMNCGIHAREWVSPATCMYVIDQLVSLYGEDSNVTSLLNMVDVTILPVLNADGYEYTWSTDRLWRKNRSPNRGSKCVGTDLNRNWQFKWGGLGASKDPCAGDYRGPAAMSEKEVKFLNGYLNSEAKRLVGYLDVHSYSQFWMIPWGSDMRNVADYDELMRISRKVAESIKLAGFNTIYDLGAPSHLLYLCTGTLQDYVYGTLKVKYSFAIELRDKGLFGFLLPPQYIEPTAKELFEGLKTLIGEMKLDKQL